MREGAVVKDTEVVFAELVSVEAYQRALSIASSKL